MINPDRKQHMSPKYIHTYLMVILLWPLHLFAQQNLDNFLDFEGVSAEGSTFTLGESPTSIQVINFTLETVENPALAHSGTKALVLVPGASEGKIVFERGVNNLQFFAADTDGGSRIELRDKNLIILADAGVVEGLPPNISPGANPPLQSFVAFNRDTLVTTDLNFTNGIKEIKIINPSGAVALDDLGYSYVDGPPDNTVFEDFSGLDNHPIFKVFVNRVNFTLGTSPVTATFTGGIVSAIINPTFFRFNHTLPLSSEGGEPTGDVGGGSWQVPDDTTGIITFETPAAKVEFYAAVIENGDGELEVFDTEGNLLTSTTDIPLNMFDVNDANFEVFSFVAEELGAPGGIGEIHYINPQTTTASGSFLNIAIDDIGFTPIGAPSGGGPSAPSITTQPASQEVQAGHGRGLVRSCQR